MNLLLFSFLFFFSSELIAKTFDRLSIQHAGEIGLVAFGLGKEVNSTYSFDLFYGYVPESIAGSEIETFAFKNHFNWIQKEFDQNIVDWYGGINIYHVTGIRYQTSRQIRYPRNYYQMASLRALFFHGLSFKKAKSSHQFYIETGINEFWLIAYMNNYEVLNPFDYFSWSLGWRIEF